MAFRSSLLASSELVLPALLTLTMIPKTVGAHRCTNFCRTSTSFFPANLRYAALPARQSLIAPLPLLLLMYLSLSSNVEQAARVSMIMAGSQTFLRGRLRQSILSAQATASTPVFFTHGSPGATWLSLPVPVTSPELFPPKLPVVPRPFETLPCANASSARPASSIYSNCIESPSARGLWDKKRTP